MPPTAQPKVSICIPAYNQTTYLEKLLQSIARQKFTDLEVIVSDDSTTDEVGNLLRNFNFGGKLKYFRHQPSLGSPENWNAAIRQATGQYVKIMHHDDAFTTDSSLSDMINYAEKHEYDFVFSNTSIVNTTDPGKNRIHEIRKFKKVVGKPWLLFFGNSLGSPSILLLKKDISSEIAYDKRFIWLVDIEYYIRLFQTTKSGGYIPAPLITTHEAMERRLTTAILSNFELQIKEGIMLYNLILPELTSITRFFMQVRLTRLFFQAKTRNREFIRLFARPPRYVQIYFSVLSFKPAYFAFMILTRCLDLIRKILYHG